MTKYRETPLRAVFSSEISPASYAEELDKPGSRSPHTAADLADFLELIADGFSLARACKRLGLKQTVLRKALDSDPELRQLYMVALRDRADYYADRAMDIALATYAGQGDADRARVAIDAIKWFTAVSHPKKYQPNYKEPVDDAVRTVAAALTDGDRARAIATLIARSRALEKHEIIDATAKEIPAPEAVQARAEQESAPDDGSETGEGDR